MENYFIFLLHEYSDAKTLFSGILTVVFLTLPLFSLDKIKVFSRLAGGQNKKGSSSRAGLKKPKKSQRGLRGSVSREHCTAAETSFI